jgi:hypothetical protein
MMGVSNVWWFMMLIGAACVYVGVSAVQAGDPSGALVLLAGLALVGLARSRARDEIRRGA